MAKFRPARARRSQGTRPPQGAVSCVILILAAMVLIMLFLYFAMKNAS